MKQENYTINYNGKEYSLPLPVANAIYQSIYMDSLRDDAKIKWEEGVKAVPALPDAAPKYLVDTLVRNFEKHADNNIADNAIWEEVIFEQCKLLNRFSNVFYLTDYEAAEGFTNAKDLKDFTGKQLINRFCYESDNQSRDSIPQSILQKIEKLKDIVYAECIESEYSDQYPTITEIQEKISQEITALVSEEKNQTKASNLTAAAADISKVDLVKPATAKIEAKLAAMTGKDKPQSPAPTPKKAQSQGIGM